MKIEVSDAIKQGIGLSFKNKTVLGLIALYSIWGIIYGIMITLYEIEPYPPVAPAFGINEALKLLATFFVSVVILYAIVKASFENLNKRDICISNAVASALKKFIPLFMATIMYSIIVIVGWAVLMIPGIFLGSALFFYGHTILLNNKGVISSFKESYNIVKGNWWQVCALYLIFTSSSFLIVAFDLILPLYSIGIVLSVGTAFLIAGVAMVVLTIVYAQLIKKEEKIQTEKVSQENIYEEKIFPKTERWIFGIGIAFIVLVMAHTLIRISIDLILQAIGLFDLLVILFVISFIFFMPVIVFAIITIMYISREHNIKITHDSVIVDWGFGFDKRTIPFEKIDDCYLEKRSVITRWIPKGLNPSTYRRRVNGKWMLRRDVSIIGVPRVVLSLKGSGFYKEFIFSTTSPEEVMKIINQQIGRAS